MESIISTPFRSLEIAATESLDTRALSDAMINASLRDPERAPNSVAVIQAYDTNAESDDGDNGWYNYKWHAWWVPPNMWRDDLTYANGDVTTCIVTPDVALAYVSMLRTLYTSAWLDVTKGLQPVAAQRGMQLPTVDERLLEFPLIRSRLPASDWRVTRIGQELYLGRSAHRIRATRQAGFVNRGDPRLSGFWSGVDEYDCVIDDELQIVLTVTGLVDAAPVATISVDEIIVDASPLPDTFNVSLPPGTRVAYVAGQSVRS